MKATLDHIGIAVKDLREALAFYRDALGLEIEAPEEVPSQRVRAHFVPVGESKLELLEATAADSPIAKYVDKRGPGLHHITLRVDDIAAALEQLKARGARLIDERPRPGAEDALVAFIHPSSAHGVLLELKQASSHEAVIASPSQPPLATRFALGDLELIALFDGYFRMDGGAMFGVIPKTRWMQKSPADEHNRVRLALRPLIVRGTRTMLVDAGLGEKFDGRFESIYGLDGPRLLDRALAAAGLVPGDVDIVLATHLHADHAGGFTTPDAAGTLVPRFPRARYVVRRGEWEDVSRIQGSSANYFVDDFAPLAKAGVLELVDEDQTIMPGVRVRRTGGHTMHHQAVWMESGGRHAVYPADLIPTAAHVTPDWIAGLDRFPIESLAAKNLLLARVVEQKAVMFFAHEPGFVAGVIAPENDAFRVVPTLK